MSEILFVCRPRPFGRQVFELVCKVGWTRIVRQLRNEGVLDTRRGVFIVKDETALRQKSCCCATSIEDHFDTVLHGIYPLD